MVVGVLSVMGRRFAQATVRDSALSRIATAYAALSFAVAGVLILLMLMDHAGMNQTVGPIAEFLSRFEAGLSSVAAR